MKFSVDPKIFEKFPGVEIGVLVITDMDNSGHNEGVLGLLRQEEKHQKEILTGVELGSLPEVSIWRKIYKDFGSGKDFCSSVESLLRRARGGEKPLPQINNLVDLYNYLSLKYHLPAGAEDLDKVVGDINLTFAQGDEIGIYIGGDKEEAAYKGEVIYKDKAGFICRRWNWREADRTKIDQESKNAVLVIEKAPNLDKDNFGKSLEETKLLLQKYLQADVQVFVLEEKKNFLEIPFKTGSRAKPIKPIIPKAQTPVLFSAIEWESRESLTYKLKMVIYQALLDTFPKVNRIKIIDIHLEHPKQDCYGDYSTNVAMVLSKRLERKSYDIVNLIKNKIDEYIKSNQTISHKTDSKSQKAYEIRPSDILEKITVAGPGFLNVTLRTPYLITLIQRLPENKNGVISTPMNGVKISVEYTDPNPFKEFHLGHLYSNVIGESVSRIFEACEAKVWRGDFYGDVGMHVAKSVWGMMKKMQQEKKSLEELEKLSIEERQQFLGQGYALGVRSYDEDKQIQEEIKELNILVYVASQEILKKEKDWQPIVNYRQYLKGKEDRLVQVQKIYEAGLRWSLEYFETIYKRLGTRFDGYYPESWVGEYGMKMVEKGLKMGVLEKSEGSVVFRGEKYGLHTRVFVNKLGLPTYEAKDLGLAFAKYRDFRYDYSINVFGKEIDEYYQVVKAAMIKIEPELGKKAFHLPHGMVRLPQGKMSSRSGNIITYEWLIGEVKMQTLKIMQVAPLTKKEKQKVAETVGLGAVRYALLKSDIGKDVVFDIDKSISLDGDSGPYLMYTYARCRSVLRKAGDKDTPGVEESLIPNPEELSLLRSLYRFPEVVTEAAKNLSPNLLCTYLFDLAQKYNLFYNKHSILSPVDSSQSTVDISLRSTDYSNRTVSFRLFLTSSTAQVIKQGLYLLGIETVERM